MDREHGGEYTAWLTAALIIAGLLAGWIWQGVRDNHSPDQGAVLVNCPAEVNRCV